MASWTNATHLPGVLRPDLTARRAGLRRDYPVAAALEPFVERYWSVRWDPVGALPYRSEILAHPTAHLTVESGDRPRHGFGLPAALLHGVRTRRFVLDLDGWGRCTAAKFRPGGYTAFSGRATPRDGVHLYGAQDVVAAVLAADDDEQRVAVLDAALAAVAPPPSPEYLQVRAVVEAMSGTRAFTRVDQVARAAGLSTRALQRLFRRYVGVGPKWVLARYRLQDAAAMIDAGGVEDLASLAAGLGWFDQAHFARDFRATVGVPPSAYLASARLTRQSTPG